MNYCKYTISPLTIISRVSPLIKCLTSGSHTSHCDCMIITSSLPKFSHLLLCRNVSWWQVTDPNKHWESLKRKNEVMNEEQQHESACGRTEECQIEGRKKPQFQFGTRFLTDPKNVFQHNAWDNVVWDEEQEAEARQKTQEQLEHAAPVEKQEEYERDADLFWDKFYNQHQNRFFKDRHWLFTEFPELYSSKGNTNPDTTNHITASSQTPERTGLENESLNECQSPQKDTCHSASGIGPFDDCSGSRLTEDCAELSEVVATQSQEHLTGDSFSSNSLGEKLKSLSTKSDSCASEMESFPGESATFRILEVGCGVGNTVFPVLSTNKSLSQLALLDPGLMVYCCDFSATAVQLVKDHRDYDSKRCHAFVWDITDDKSPLPFPSGSLDVVVMIFVLSAVHPDKMQLAVDRLASCLKPGGLILLRDYGRYDLAQLRFKPGRCLSENFYARGDGTRVYFFTQEEFHSMFQKAGLEKVQNLIDRRLQVNRGRQIKMYRVWIQCKYLKPVWSTETKDKSAEEVV